MAIEEVRVLKADGGERDRSHHDQCHGGHHCTAAEVVHHIRHPKAARVANEK
jgi:hypothetical protein